MDARTELGESDTGCNRMQCNVRKGKREEETQIETERKRQRERDREREREGERGEERARERASERGGERRSEKMQSPRHKSAISRRGDARFTVVTDRSVNQLAEVEMNHNASWKRRRVRACRRRIVTVAAVIRAGG